MHHDFWHERWHRGETGWHLEGANPLLEQYWPRLGIPAGARVFVPLCGKSEDLVWLSRQGLRVVGVELSTVAVEAFFADHGWTPDTSVSDAGTVFRAENIEIHCGDYFQLGRSTLGSVDAVYDRGALVALPAPLRERYAEHLRTVLPQPIATFLITFDYRQDEMTGPPFAVSAADVNRFFGATHTIEVLSHTDVLADSPHFRERGVTAMTELTFALVPTTTQWP